MPGPAASQLCERLGIQYPVIQAPMAGGYTTPELVGAVSEAGGMGTFPASFMSVYQLRSAIEAIVTITEKPFGVNFLIAPPESMKKNSESAMQAVLNNARSELSLPHMTGLPEFPSTSFEQLVELVAEKKVPLVSFSMGLPDEATVRFIKESGAFTIIGITTVNEALAAVDVGADAVVAQGFEAGGHRFTFDVSPNHPLPMIGTFALVPQVVDAVSVPVIATGGIMEGRTAAAAFALGASAVQLGTRFLLSNESGAFPSYRELLLNATEESTVVTRSYTGRPARGIRNSFVRAVEGSGVEPLPWPFQAVVAGDIYGSAPSRADAEWFSPYAGQGLRMARRNESAGEIVRSVLEEAVEVIGGLN